MILFFIRLWYRFTMVWTRWRKPTAAVQPISRADEIPLRIREGNDYRADPKFFDYLAHPRCFQARVNAGENTFDCEDHATYWAVVMHKSGLCKKVALGMVYWLDQAGKRQGHVVCVYEDLYGRKFWADYRTPTPIEPYAPWWHFGIDVLSEFQGKRLLKVAYIEITDVHADDTPIFRGEHLTKGHWFGKSFWES